MQGPSDESSSEESFVCENKYLNRARYDNYRVYKVKVITEDHIKLFKVLKVASDSYTVYGSVIKTCSLIILVPAHKIADFTDLLELNKIPNKVLTYNFQHKIDAQFRDVQPKTISPSRFDWDHYFHLETIYSWMDKLAYEHKFITVVIIGSSYDNIPIKGLKISHKATNPSIFIESGIHAREWISTATATYLINELVFSEDPKIQQYANSINWIIIPTVNPDGYKYSFEKDRMWRKNRSLFGLCRGVDLNRNFPFHWNEIGSSSNPCSSDFAGTASASEKETRGIIDYIRANKVTANIKSYISLHSFSQLLMFPYAYTNAKVKNYTDLKEISEKAVAEIKRISGESYKMGSIHDTIYPSSGNSKDWAYAIANIPLTFTFELRGPADSPDLFILPANEIRITGIETIAAILTIAEEGEKKGYFMKNKAILKT